MNKIGQYLQEHVSGEVVASADARQYFSTDASILTLTPSLIVYPKSENDVRKVARFTWQLAERNRIVPITARGGGSDQAGAAIGTGIIMAFTAHMNRIVELDAKSGLVVVEPGMNYGRLQQTLETHGRFLPPYPASLEYATLGGAVANNAVGEKSVKYGDTRAYVRGLRVVLANGEMITTERLGHRELNKKMGLTSFEGEIYRTLDGLLEEHKDTLALMERRTARNASGYDLADIKRKDGSFDLTPLFVGSQGTLGIVTEISLDTEPHNPETSLLVAAFDDAQRLQQAVLALKAEHEVPSALEVVDGNLLNLVGKLHPAHLKGVVNTPYPQFILLAEYDDTGRTQKKSLKRGLKILEKQALQVQSVTNLEDQEELWKVRHAAALAVAHAEGGAKALPFIEDGAVPPDKLAEFLTGIYGLFERSRLPVAIWGHAGDANLHVQPYLDLNQLGDRQKLFRLMDEYYRLVISLGGAVSAGHGEGRVRAPYIDKMYGDEVYELLGKVKKLFDPHGTLNPGVKFGTSLEDIKLQLRPSYNLSHLYQHLPRS